MKIVSEPYFQSSLLSLGPCLAGYNQLPVCKLHNNTLTQ